MPRDPNHQPLTAAKMRNLKPPDKLTRLYDSHGLYLEMSPAGGRWWRFKFTFGGKHKRLSLGTYPEVSLAAARLKRDEMKRLLREGIDPSAHRKHGKAVAASRLVNSFEAVAREWHAKMATAWTRASATNAIRRLELDAFPAIGARPVDEIEAPELLQALRGIEARGALPTARMVLGTCGQVFQYAMATGRARRNPARDLRGALTPYRGSHRAAILSEGRIRELLRAIDAYRGSFIVTSAMKLLPLTFVRPGELRSARWADIDLDAGTWSYRVTKTRTDHIVPLSRQAVAILRALHPLTGSGEMVFPSRHTLGAGISSSTLLVALRSMGFTKDEMSAHGWRSVARTWLDEVLGFRADLIEHQLAHTVRGPLGATYNRAQHLPERRRMMQAWADHLDGVKAGVGA